MSLDQKPKSNAVIESINTYLGAAKDRFYELDPIQQLDKRATFEQNFKELALNNPFDTTSSDDLFAIYDAVSRRGGFKKVQEEKRWDDIVNSLNLYNFTPQSLENTYKACLAKYEEKYYSEAEDYVIKGSKIDRYFIPLISTRGLYEGYFKSKLTSTEMDIMKKLKVEHPDLYICFRNIILAKKEPNLSELLDYVPTTYHETFIKLFKLFYIYGVVDGKKLKHHSPTSLEFLNIPDLNMKKVTIIGANMRGVHCANLLKDFGFRVEIIDYQSSSNSSGRLRSEEELYEFMPFTINNDASHPVVKLLNDANLTTTSIKVSDLVVFNGNGDILEKSNIEVKKNEFQEILRVIMNLEDKSMLFQDALKDEVKAKFQDSAESKDLIDLFVHKLKFFSKLPIDSLSIAKFQELFLKYDQEFFSNIYNKERLAIFNESIANAKASIPNNNNIKIHREKVDKIYHEENRIGLRLKREDLETDYLVFCYNNSFYSDLVKGMKGYDLRKNNNFEDSTKFSKDFIRMSHKITDHLTAFRDLESISFPLVFLSFRKKFWSSLREDLILIHEVDQPFLMLTDLSKTKRENAHLLLVCKLSTAENEFQLDDAQKKKIFKLLSKIFYKNADNSTAFESNLKDIFINNNTYFTFKNNPSNLNKAIKGILNPCKKIFFNIPISNGKVTDKIGMSITNNFSIVGQILSDCMNLDEFDQSTYESRFIDDFKISKKKSVTQANSAKPSNYDRNKESTNNDSHKSSTSKMMEEEKSVPASSSSSILPKDSLVLNKRFSDAPPSREKSSGDTFRSGPTGPNYSMMRSNSQPIPSGQNIGSGGPVQAQQGLPVLSHQSSLNLAPSPSAQHASTTQLQGLNPSPNSHTRPQSFFVNQIQSYGMQETGQQSHMIGKSERQQQQQPIIVNDNPVDGFNMLSGDQIAKILIPPQNQNLLPSLSNGIEKSPETNKPKSLHSHEYDKACEYIGISHPVVQKHNQFLGFYLPKTQEEWSDRQMLDNYIDLLELRKPYKITNNFYICKLGGPVFIEPKEGAMEAKNIEFYDGFVSFRQYASFLSPETLVYFYQTVLYIKEIEQMVFAVIPEDNEELVLFHTDPEKLMTFVFKKIENMTKGSAYYFKYKKQSKRFSFPSLYTAHVRQKIYAYHKIEPDFDLLMEKIYDSAIGKPRFEMEVLVGLNNELAVYNHPIEVLKNVFNQKLREWRMDTQMDLGDFFFGTKHPKVIAFTNLARMNRNLALQNLEPKIQHHLACLSKYCEVKKLNFDPEMPESIEVSDYQVRRLCLDVINPSECVWYICERFSKKRSKKATITSSMEEGGGKFIYQIIPYTSYDQITRANSKKEVTSGSTALECLENLMKKMMKHVDCKRMIIEFFEKLFAVEFREYHKKDKILKLFSIMQDNTTKERLNMEVEKFDTFFTKNIGPEKKGELGEDLERLKEKLRETYRADSNLELVDNRYLIVAYKK